MDKWQDWVAVIVGAVVAYLFREHASHKASILNSEQKQNDKIADLTERVIKTESELMTEKEVREILKEFFYPFMDAFGEIQKDIQEIKVTLAKQDKGDK